MYMNKIVQKIIKHLNLGIKYIYLYELNNYSLFFYPF